MPSTLRKCSALGCFANALCCYGRCAAHCSTYCTAHRISCYSTAPVPRRQPQGCHGFLGLEFEIVPRCGRGRADLARIARHVTSDSSVRGPHGAGAECKMISWCDRAPAVVRGWLQRLHAAGCPATVNRSCGLHVHLDIRRVDRDRSRLFATALLNASQEWRALMPPSRRDNTYITWADDIHDRYSWVNIRSDTIEIRCHPGTLNPYKAGAWTAVCADLLHAVRGSDAVPSAIHPRHALFGPDAREYLQARADSGGAL